MTEQSHDFAYIGSELSVFSKATNWKQYWGSKIKPYLGSTVLEVGAGIGGTTQVLASPEFDLWLGIEPDAAMVKDLNSRLNQGEFPDNCQFKVATVDDLSSDQLFDSIIYIDVLEHIEDHQAEVTKAIEHLKPGGHLIVLSPAFQFLFTEFDEAIGHYRRYTRQMMVDLTPTNATVVNAFYLDAVGMLTSIANKLLLRSSQPNERQIWLWDKWLVPISKTVVDRLIGYSAGRSVVCIWQRNPQ